MKFKTLKAYNLYSFPALDFKFNFRGTTLIIGRSDDENTANGSGKTSIIKILYLGLWGKELYDATLDSVKYRNATDGWLIEIEFEHRGHNYKIVRYRDRKHRDDKVQESKSGVEFYSDGQPYPGEGPSEIQKGIEATLGLSPKLFKSSVLTAQGEQKHFLTVSDTEKKEIFSELLDLTIYSSSFNFVKKEIDALEEKIKAVEQKIEDGNNRIKDKNEEIAKFQAEEDNFEDKKIISVNLLTAKKAKLNLEIDQLKQSNLESSALLEKEKELLQVLEDKVKAKLEFSAGLEEEEATAEVHLEYSGKLSSIRSEGESVSNQKKDAESELAKLIKRKANPSDLDRKVIDLKSSATVVESLLPGVSNYQSEISHLTSAAFSVCSLFDTDTEEKIEELNKKISKLNLDREQKLKSYSEVKEKVTKLKESLDKFKIQKDRISNLDKEINKLNQDLKIIAEKKKKIENIEPEVNAKLQLIEEANSQIEQEKLKNNPFKDILDVAKKRVEDLSEVLERNKKTISGHEEEMIYLNFWKAAFSPLGIRSFIFDEVIDLLNQKVQDNLNDLFDGAISVVFESESKNNKGLVSNKISTKYYMRGKETTEELISGGEKRRAIIAVNLALTEIAESYSNTVMNIKFLDEPFEGIDSQGQIQCFKLFARLAQNKDGFFVISHDPSFQQLCPNVVRVIKQNEASRIVSREEFDPGGDLNNLTAINDN